MAKVTEKQLRSRFQKHLTTLMWKYYLQRLRRWPTFVVEVVFALILFLLAVFLANPVFLTPLEDQPQPPLAFYDILSSLHSETILGYAPNVQPYITIMERVEEILTTEIISAPTEVELNMILYKRSQGHQIVNKVMWILWQPIVGNFFNVSIRSTEVARFYAYKEPTIQQANPHLRTGFLAVQLAVSQAVLEYVSPLTPEYELSLVSMPLSPMMEQGRVRQVISLILMCYTIALLPPVLETQALVVSETSRRFKRALRLRNVDFTTIYFGWLTYAFLTAGPICLLGSIVLILIFRWVDFMTVQLALMAYTCLMTMLAFIMSMFHDKARIAAIWSTLQTLLQTCLAELMVHHGYYEQESITTFVIHMFLPPLGLLNALNKFALLQTDGRKVTSQANSLWIMVLSWLLLIVIYFLVLMLMQRTLGSDRAIGGQVSWKSIIFKKVEDPNKLRPVKQLTGNEQEKLQKVDEFVAKAISFRNVSKKILRTPVITDLTFDIYRGEYTMVVTERIQDKLMGVFEDLIIGLTNPDSGTVNVLGEDMKSSKNMMTAPNMMGYCDRSSYLIDDLTVEEHFTMYTNYAYLRTHRLMEQCDLEQQQHTRVENLGVYYKAQLCWAIAILLEPRIVVVPYYYDDPLHMAVIRDKILQYRTHMTIIKISLSSVDIEFADRIFLLDNKEVAFGGTPAYMFFKFGREYRIRISFKTNRTLNWETLMEVINESGAHIRAHLGSMLILRVPTSPSSKIAQLLEHLHLYRGDYGIVSLNVSLPDPDEVFKRAIHESRSHHNVEVRERDERSKRAIGRITVAQKWVRESDRCGFMRLNLRTIAWKYFSFYIHYRFFAIITVVASIAAGIFIGLSITKILLHLGSDQNVKRAVHGQVLTVEAMGLESTLVLRIGNTSVHARSFANAYVMSHTGSPSANVARLKYIALDGSESLMEYLAIRAIDSPQLYLNEHAYGVDVSEKKSTLVIKALYSPLHVDHGAAPRSLARAYMALMRHYTGQMDATIQFNDDPLVLDLTPWTAASTEPSILIQFLLVLTIAHITLVPSNEYGYIRHNQMHAMNYSPARYWFSLAFCHLIHYWVLVVIMYGSALAMLFLTVPYKHSNYQDLVVVPFTLIVYGIGCIPQAYLFSLGPRPPLNTMFLIIVNIVFGEATIMGKLFSGDMYTYALNFMSLSPQYNMAYALARLRYIFIHNSECMIFKTEQLCSSKILHKCCDKCGVLQECFKRRSYLDVLYLDLLFTFVAAVLFMTTLLLWEYRVIPLLWHMAADKIFYTREPSAVVLKVGAGKEKTDVLNKQAQMQIKRNFQNLKLDTFGEHLLVVDLSRFENMFYVVHHVFLGLGKGETIALCGLRRHGRVMLCEILAGYRTRCEGHIYAMSKYRLKYSPHNYARQVSFSGSGHLLPGWMTVYDALEMIAILRGVPKKHVDEELLNYIEALDLCEVQDLLVCRLQPAALKRVNFAAAVVGAPPVLITDECTAYQNHQIRRAMYHIIFTLKKRGHSIIHSDFNVESQMPISNRLAIVRDGLIYDTDYIDNLLGRYSDKGTTVVVHLSDDVDIHRMFSRYFDNFIINDTNEALVNVQVMDNLEWATIFQKMEKLKTDNKQVYSYIVCAKPISYIYNTILSREEGFKKAGEFLIRPCVKKCFSPKIKFEPPPHKLAELKYFDNKYDITSLTDLPWSVIFHR